MLYTGTGYLETKLAVVTRN